MVGASINGRSSGLSTRSSLHIASPNSAVTGSMEEPNNYDEGEDMVEDDSNAPSRDSQYWNKWKKKIGSTTDKLSNVSNISKSESDKNIGNGSKDLKGIDIVKNKSSLSLSNKDNSWWSWRNDSNNNVASADTLSINVKPSDSQLTQQLPISSTSNNNEDVSDVESHKSMAKSIITSRSSIINKKRKKSSIESNKSTKPELNAQQKNEINEREIKYPAKSLTKKSSGSSQSLTGDKVPSTPKTENGTQPERVSKIEPSSKWLGYFIKSTPISQINTPPYINRTIAYSSVSSATTRSTVNNTVNSWWQSAWPWNTFNDSKCSIDIEDNDQHEFVESRIARRKIYKLDDQKPSSWAFASRDSEFSHGTLVISGTDFEENPVTLFKELPATKMEENEVKNILKNSKNKPKCSKSSNNSTVIFPKFNECYRPLSTKTKMRLITRKMFHNMSIIENVVPIERHLYHDIKVPTNAVAGDSVVINFKKLLIVDIQNFLPLQLTKYVEDASINTMKPPKSTIEMCRNWGEKNNININSLDIEMILLRGKNVIKDAVENYFRLIVNNWIDKFSECDYLLFVSNFNAVHIGVHLLSKFFEKLEFIFTRIEKIGFISINGLWGGPNIENDINNNENSDGSFKSLDKQILGEIYRYSDPNSDQSYSLNHELKLLLSHNNVKFSLIGNLHDKFIPLYSSLCYQFSHPNINRIVCANQSENHFNPFITLLVQICVQLKNLGYDDYNMLIYLSDYLIKYLNQTSISLSNNINVYEDNSLFQESLIFCFETTQLYVNEASELKIKSEHTQTENEPQILEGQQLRSGNDSNRNIKHAFKRNGYYVNNREDVIKYSKINYRQLLGNFNDFQYPWLLNKLLKELQSVKHLNSEELVENLRVLVLNWQPKDLLSQNLKNSLDVIAVKDYL